MTVSSLTINDSVPTNLPPRYEIRQLTEKHIPWASAIIIHSNIFCSPLWTAIYPDGRTARAYRAMAVADYLVRHQITSGLSFGVFDTEYQFKKAESEATDGKLYWDETDLDADQEKLLSQMDFPLCSVALSYDGINGLDMEKLMPLIQVLPAFSTIYHTLETLDPRDPESWKPKHPHEVLMRNATSTRADYEGQGFMKKLAHYLMRHAASLGFRGIQIECAHDAVTHTWLHPPEPFKAQLISSFRTETYEEDADDESGKKVNPFGEAKQLLTKVFVTL
jgi:hypothetical protein